MVCTRALISGPASVSRSAPGAQAPGAPPGRATRGEEGPRIVFLAYCEYLSAPEQKLSRVPKKSAFDSFFGYVRRTEKGASKRM